MPLKVLTHASARMGIATFRALRFIRKPASRSRPNTAKHGQTRPNTAKHGQTRPNTAKHGPWHLDVNIRQRGSQAPLHLLIDSTGIKVEGEGQGGSGNAPGGVSPNDAEKQDNRIHHKQCR